MDSSLLLWVGSRVGGSGIVATRARARTMFAPWKSTDFSMLSLVAWENIFLMLWMGFNSLFGGDNLSHAFESTVPWHIAPKGCFDQFSAAIRSAGDPDLADWQILPWTG